MRHKSKVPDAGRGRGEANQGLPALSGLGWSMSQSALVFPKTPPGQPQYLILTMRQSTNADLPLEITTDAPERFQLATDAHPAFAPRLTVAPKQASTHVHVRYTPDQVGRHEAQLTILTTQGQQTVPLLGYCERLLPVLRQAAQGVSPKGKRSWAGSSRGPWRGLVGVVLFSGLAWAGYANRCELAPSLCASALATESVPTVVPHAPIRPNLVTEVPPARVHRSLRTRREPGQMPSSKWRGTQTVNRPTPADSTSASQVVGSGEVTRSTAAPQRSGRTKPSEANVEETPSPRRSPEPPSEESELERLLNQPSNHP